LAGLVAPAEMAAHAATALLTRLLACTCVLAATAPAAAERGGLLGRLDVLSALMQPRPKFAAVEGHSNSRGSGGGLRRGNGSSSHHSSGHRGGDSGGPPSLLPPAARASSSQRLPPPPSLAACTLVKDSLNAAQQWVAFLVLQGFERVVFYDDLSPPRASPPLTPADFGGLAQWVEVVAWSGPDIPQNHLQGLRQAAVSAARWWLRQLQRWSRRCPRCG
jgi:hypothetical protein